MDKKGQIAIFVILAIVLVGSIFIYFSIAKKPHISERVEEFNPESFIDKCVKEEVRDTVELILPQGGFMKPTDYKIYKDIEVPYLCKNLNFYDRCITQHPLYLSQVENEISTNILNQVENCFESLENELTERDYQHFGGPLNIETKLKPGKIENVIKKDFSFSKDNFNKEFDSIRTSINSPLYQLIFVANEIVSQESKNCYFSNIGYMALYPSIDIKKFVLSDSTKIYTIKDKLSGAETNIAIRGCAIPAGI
jgi:hypothetical protein